MRLNISGQSRRGPKELIETSLLSLFATALLAVTTAKAAQLPDDQASGHVAADGELDLRPHGISRSPDKPARRARYRSRRRNRERGYRENRLERNAVRRAHSLYCRPSALISSSAAFRTVARGARPRTSSTIGRQVRSSCAPENAGNLPSNPAARGRDHRSTSFPVEIENGATELRG